MSSASITTHLSKSPKLNPKRDPKQAVRATRRLVAEEPKQSDPTLDE